MKSSNIEDKNSIIQRIEDKLKIGKPLEFNENEEHSFSQWLSLTKIKKIDRHDVKKGEMELIDHFIKNNPSIKTDKNKFFSPSETIKNSLIEKDELVTETLKSLSRQEHFDKAIEFYKNLSFKYPKKVVSL